MSWSKFVYHSLLTVVLGVTLSVCSNVMETDDFEIEAIASVGLTHERIVTPSGSDNCTSSNSITILTPGNGHTLTKSNLNIRISPYPGNPCQNGTTSDKVSYTVVGNL